MSKNNKISKKTSNQSSKFVFWMIGLVAICIGVFIFLSNSTSTEKVTIDYAGQPFLGEESAPVKIIEFGDYKCPYCKNFTESFFPQIDKDFVKTGKASFYFINYAFINIDSERSAKFAEAVYQELGNDKFWKFHNLLYKKQPADPSSEKMDVYTESFLTDVLKEIASKQETEKVISAFQKNLSQEALDKDMKIAGDLGLTATPSVYINGVKFDGQTYDDFKTLVNDASKGE